MSRRGRPPGQKEPEVFAKEPYFSENNAEFVAVDTIEVDPPQDDITSAIPEPNLSVDGNAFSVSRKGKIYQLVKIPYSSELLMPGQPEVIFESTDRWEVQSQFVFHTEEAFLVVEDL